MFRLVEMNIVRSSTAERAYWAERPSHVTSRVTPRHETHGEATAWGETDLAKNRSLFLSRAGNMTCRPVTGSFGKDAAGKLAVAF